MINNNLKNKKCMVIIYRKKLHYFKTPSHKDNYDRKMNVLSYYDVVKRNY